MNEPNYHLDKGYFHHPLEFRSIFLLQIGRMFCKSTTKIEPHIHSNLYELTIVTDGKAVISTNGVPTYVKKGDIYLSYPGDVHQIESDRDEPLKYDFFAFRLNDEKFKEDFESIAQDYSLPSTRLFHDDRIRSLIRNAITELDSDDNYSTEILNSVFCQIIIYVIRGFKNIGPQKNLSNFTRAELLCHRLMNYIDTHIYSMKNLNELSALTEYSYGYLSSLFKRTTQLSLSDYFREKRLDAARLLLLDGKFSATEISELLNYSSVYAFSKAFKEHFGTSPKNYNK